MLAPTFKKNCPQKHQGLDDSHHDGHLWFFFQGHTVIHCHSWPLPWQLCAEPPLQQYRHNTRPNIKSNALEILIGIRVTSIGKIWNGLEWSRFMQCLNSPSQGCLQLRIITWAQMTEGSTAWKNQLCASGITILTMSPCCHCQWRLRSFVSSPLPAWWTLKGLVKRLLW